MIIKVIQLLYIKRTNRVSIRSYIIVVHSHCSFVSSLCFCAISFLFVLNFNYFVQHPDTVLMKHKLNSSGYLCRLLHNTTNFLSDKWDEPFSLFGEVVGLSFCDSLALVLVSLFCKTLVVRYLLLISPPTDDSSRFQHDSQIRIKNRVRLSETISGTGWQTGIVTRI